MCLVNPDGSVDSKNHCSWVKEQFRKAQGGHVVSKEMLAHFELCWNKQHGGVQSN